MNILIVLGFSLLSAFLYRLGGVGDPFNTKIRDLGVPTCMLVVMALLGHWHNILLLCFLLMFGAQVSYFKKKGELPIWYNWLLVGLAFSAAMLPYSVVIKNYDGFLYRSIVVTVFTIIWSEVVNLDWLDEAGRGFVQIATLPFLFV